MSSINEMIAASNKRRDEDATRYEASDGDLCMLCHAYGNDKRSLFIRCFYAVHEVVPEAIDLGGVKDKELSKYGYYVRLCKSCRGRLLGHLKTWRDECVALQPIPKDHDGYLEEEDDTRNIYVRINGVNVAMNADEYAVYASEHKAGGAA
jgi:hypothetical protein